MLEYAILQDGGYLATVMFGYSISTGSVILHAKLPKQFD